MTEKAAQPRMSELERDELVQLLRDLIRVRSVNPPGDEILAARFVEKILAAECIPSTVVEPFPGRGSIVARVRGDGSGGDPLLLLSHLDVVPAEPEGWSHDPFSGDVADGYVWGRGALDMKSMVAMEIQVMRRLARTARAAGLDPATAAVPGLRRDVVFCASAGEEAGGHEGAGWLVDNHPEWLAAAAALNEAGGLPMPFGGVRFYPIQVAEKGYVVYRLHVRGRWGHGSVPTADNAALLAARVVERLADQGPGRLTEAMAAAAARALPRLPDRIAKIIGPVIEEQSARSAGAVGDGLAALDDMCDPVLARTISAMTHDTVSVGIVQAGVKYNVIPGTATLEIDCRTLPGTDEPAMRAELRRRIGEELWARLEVECTLVGEPAQAPLDGPMYPLLEQVLRDHDPEAVPVPFMAPWATDAKHLTRIGVPVYGFSPLGIDRGEGLLDLMHGVDERVSVDGLAWGMEALYDAVVRFCA